MDRRVEKIERKGGYGMKEKIRVVFDIDVCDGFGCCF
jgi:hypothetical protein